MAKKTDKNDGMMKTGGSRRSRSGRTGRSNTVPRVMILGLLVVVAGGAALFWPRGGSVPTGIGENQTVVASPGTNQAQESLPRSGDVDINAEATPALTPEAPEGEVAKSPAEESGTLKSPVPVDPEPTPKPTPKPTPNQQPNSTTAPAVKREPKIHPIDSGPYVIQVASFGLAENADKEAARIKALGWEARVQAGNNANGEMVFRVWIVSFANRQDAQTFINQNNRHLAGAIPVHR